jgi:hypothetical protein
VSRVDRRVRPCFGHPFVRPRWAKAFGRSSAGAHSAPAEARAYRAANLACSGPLDLRPQAEVHSALKTDTPPSAVASGFIAAGQVEHCYAFFAGELLSPSARERVQHPVPQAALDGIGADRIPLLTLLSSEPFDERLVSASQFRADILRNLARKWLTGKRPFW